MHIIGLNGAAGAGKDTLAQLIMKDKSYKKGWLTYSFAQPIRQMVSVGFGIPMDVLTDPVKKNDPAYGFAGKSPRYLMQTLGTEWGRDLVHTNVWIEVFKSRVGKIDTDTVGGIIITDCRFENEARAIRELGGDVFRIVRSDNPYTQNVSSGGVAAHASEAGLPYELIDYTIYNDSISEMMLESFKHGMFEIGLRKFNSELAKF